MRIKVGIVGAGVGGLAAATLLARAGHEVTVFDRFDAPRPVGSGLMLQPVGLAVLDRLGAGPGVRAAGTPVTAMLGHERTGRRVLDVSYRGRFGLGIHRAALFEALLSAARVHGATIRVAAEVRSSRCDGRRFVALADREEGPFDLVVDASGARSPFAPLRARPLPYGAIWGTVPWPDTPLPYDELRQRYRRADRMAGVLPIGRMPGRPEPLAAIFWSLRVADWGRWRTADLDDWKAEATEHWPELAPFLATIRTHDDMTLAAYSHGTLARPWAERLVHIGDAAHRASPQLGQGANMALLDAAALAQAVAERGVDCGPAYAHLRRWHVRAYQAMSAIFTPQYQSGGWLHPTLRDWLFVPLTRVPPVPHILTRIVCGDVLPPVRGTPREKP